MDTSAPISTLMVSKVQTVTPETNLESINTIFNEKNIHHLPVVGENNEIVGLVSDSDLHLFQRGFTVAEIDRLTEQTRMRAFKAKDIMVKDIETLSPDATIKEALALFKQNRFNCIPLVQNDMIKGIVTTYDIIAALHDA